MARTRERNLWRHGAILVFLALASVAPGQVESARATRFRLGSGTGRFHAWGRGEDTRFFFSGFLPALFERTLVLDDLKLGGGRLEWIFTGDRGGFTVTVDDEEVGLCQQFYDSPGFNAVSGEAPRHPQWQSPAESARQTDPVRELGVVVDHKLGLTIRVNGRAILHQECLLDVSRHQLRLAGGTAAEQHVAGRLLQPQTRAARVVVHPATVHQKMMGFGGIMTPTAYAELSRDGKDRWWRLLVEYNLLIQREYPIGRRLNDTMDNWDTLADATPHYYGDNFPNGEISDFEYIRQLRGLGGKVWFEFWALPPWVGKDVEKYADAMVRYCRVSREKAGAPPDIVGVQNEVQQSPEMWHAMTLALRRKLDEAGFEAVQIHMSDSGSLAGGIERAEAFRRSAKAWSAVDYAATHMYDYQGFFTRPDEYDARLLRWKELTGDKPFLSTELCVNNSRYQWPSYRLAFLMGQLYHKNLVLTDAVAICYCWTLLNVEQPSYGWTRSLCVPDRARGFVPAASSHQLRVFGAYSRRIREAMVRVSTSGGTEDLLVSAFAGPESAATVVLLNRATAPIQVSVVWPGVAFSEMEIVDPYRENQSVPGAGTGQSDIVVAPGSVVTLTNVPLGR
ncbi:MAG: hypothetical protein JW741_12600 [Sedimentisphaerales bacterium]|nr:hypothetical protein [Sedimentisphaerales bacterium]